MYKRQGASTITAKTVYVYIDNIRAVSYTQLLYGKFYKQTDKSMGKIVFAALCAFAAVAVYCKNDRESDVNPGDSDIDGLYINEVYSCNPDWVELYNAGNEELHIGGFILQDDKGAEEEYVIPEGTTIGAGEFLVLEEFSFGISSSKGDRVTLLDASRNVVDDVMLPVMEDGSSYEMCIRDSNNLLTSP